MEQSKPTGIPQSKFEILVLCNRMRDMIDTIEHRTNGIPNEDTPQHADLVDQFRMKVKLAYLHIGEAETFGII